MPELRMFEPKTQKYNSFIVIREEMKWVRDLLVAISSAQNSVVEELLEQKRALEADPTPVLASGIDMRQDIIDGLDEFHLPFARESASAIAQGASLLIVFAFLERALRTICEDVSGSEGIVEGFVDCKRKGSKVDRYLMFLEQKADLTLDLPDDFQIVRQREREVRNMFAHGDWDLHWTVARYSSALVTLARLTPVFESIELAVLDRCAA